MNEKPVPPVLAPESDQLGGVPAPGEGRSPYGGMSAQETVDAYLGRLRSIKAQSIALVIANVVAMIWFIEKGHVALYFFGFALLFAIVLIARARMASLFVKLGEAVSQDCDPARYRAVLDVLSARDALSRLSAFRASFKEGSRNRAVIDSQIADFAVLVRPPAVLVRPPADRDAADAALEPLTPRMEHLRAEVLSGLEAHFG